MGVKLKAEYGPVLHMPVLKEVKDRALHPGNMQGQQRYTQPGNHDSTSPLDSPCTLHNPSLQSVERRCETKIHVGILSSSLQKAQFDFATARIVCGHFSYFLNTEAFLHTVSGEDPEYLITGTHAYPSAPGKYVIFIKQLAYINATNIPV